MKRSIKKITTLLIASASVIALGGMVGLNSIKRTAPTTVRAADSVATFNDSSDNVYESLSEAIEALPDGGKIIISSGTVAANLFKASFNNGSSYEIVIEGDVNVVVDGTSLLSVTSNTDVKITANNGTLTFDGSSNETNGQLIAVNNSSLQLKGSIIVDGITNSSKNGPVLTASRSAIKLDGITIKNCKGSTGGAIWSDGCDVFVENATFTGNTAVVGGAMYISGGTFESDCSTFSSNSGAMSTAIASPP